MLFEKVEKTENIIANVDDFGVKKLLKKLGLENKVTSVSTSGETKSANVVVDSYKAISSTKWKLDLSINGDIHSLETNLTGSHNMSNLAQVIALILKLQEDGVISSSHSVDDILNAVASFEGVARRMDLLGEVAGVEIFEDFAHHPTAVKLVIDGFKKTHPNKRLLVAFEPKNATSRRNIFTEEYVKAFAAADKVYIGACPMDKRIDEKNRMNTSDLAEKIGASAQAFSENDDLLDAIIGETKSGDAIIYMSSGSFSGIQYRTAEALGKKFLTDKCS